MINIARPSIAQCPQSDASSDTACQCSIRFWGVRGSVPTPSSANQKYGGNTLCVEVVMGDQRLILDGGTGIVSLGHQLLQESGPSRAHIFFTHTQWDRIQGFPFFQPAFIPGNHFTIYGGTAPNGASIKHCLTDQMLQPHFTLPLQNMRAALSFRPLANRACFQIEEIEVETFQSNSVTQALAYRLSWQDYTVVYATDTPTERVDLDFLRFVEKANILIYDGTYSDLTYLKGNNELALQPWELGIEIAQKADIDELVLLHHSPVQNDTALDQLQKHVSDRFPNAKVAYEGMELNRY